MEARFFDDIYGRMPDPEYEDQAKALLENKRHIISYPFAPCYLFEPTTPEAIKYIYRLHSYIGLIFNLYIWKYPDIWEAREKVMTRLEKLIEISDDGRFWLGDVISREIMMSDWWNKDFNKLRQYETYIINTIFDTAKHYGYKATYITKSQKL